MTKPLDAVLITHEHYDHVGGIDDLRPFTFEHDLPLFADDYACRHLRQRLPYCLVRHTYPGIPKLDLHEIKEGDKMQFGELEVTAIRVMHGELPIMGYRIGDVAYLTDMTELFDSSLPLLDGIKLLIIGALRHTPHKTHQTVEHAIEFSRSLGDIPTYFMPTWTRSHRGVATSYTCATKSAFMKWRNRSFPKASTMPTTDWYSRHNPKRHTSKSQSSH